MVTECEKQLLTQSYGGVTHPLKVTLSRWNYKCRRLLLRLENRWL